MDWEAGGSLGLLWGFLLTSLRLCHQEAAPRHDVLYLLCSARDCFYGCNSSLLFFFPSLLKGQRLVFCLNELLCSCLSERNPCERKSPVPPCYHSWELNREAPFLDMVTQVWQNVLGMDTTEKAICAQEQLGRIEHPPSTSNTHPKQVNGIWSVQAQILTWGWAVNPATVWCCSSHSQGADVCILLQEWGFSLGEGWSAAGTALCSHQFVSVQGKSWQGVGVSTEVTEMCWMGVTDRAE